MSKDKHKQRDRAFAYIRSLKRGWNGFPKGITKATISGPLSKVQQYCIDRGFASLRRTKPGELRGSRARHNLFDAE